jgi:hypothetical protein
LFLEDFFTVYVGPAKKVVKIPPSLLTKHSAPLKAMISNGMKETEKKVATLPDEEPETQWYFLEWAVNGVYRVTETTDVSDVEQEKSGNVTRYNCTLCHKFTSEPTQVNIALWCSTCKLAPIVRCLRCNRNAIFKALLRPSARMPAVSPKYGKTPGLMATLSRSGITSRRLLSLQKPLWELTSTRSFRNLWKALSSKFQSQATCSHTPRYMFSPRTT